MNQQTARSARWHEAKVFAEVNARDVASLKPNLLEELFVWFKAVNLYHQGDLSGVPTERDRGVQKQILSALTSTGEWLVSELRQHDITAQAGVTLADVEATLEELYFANHDAVIT